MGCGSSSSGTVTEDRSSTTRTGKVSNGTNNHHHDNDDVPTVVLPESPVKPKPRKCWSLSSEFHSRAIAFEIPIEEFDGNRRPNTPPVHLQRLLQPPQPEISLPDIKEKLAEAEQRRQSILQARAASAQKRAQKMMKSVHEMDVLDSEHEPPDNTKHVTNNLTIPPEPGMCEDRNIA